MSRDVQIGLSLAVVVVGFAGAFCFRHPADDAVPALARPDRVDAELAGRDHAPYLDRPAAAPRGSAPADDPFAKPAFLVTPPESREPAVVAEVTVPDPVPDPVPELRVYDAAEPHAVVEPPVTVANETEPASVRPRPAVTHTVEPGDTLTGISLRHLGSVRHYLDLYEANRDVLADPDSLRVGMTLRIPRL